MTREEQIATLITKLQALVVRRRFPGRQKLLKDTIVTLAEAWESYREERD